MLALGTCNTGKANPGKSTRFLLWRGQCLNSNVRECSQSDIQSCWESFVQSASVSTKYHISVLSCYGNMETNIGSLGISESEGLSESLQLKKADFFGPQKNFGFLWAGDSTEKPQE